jgi:Sulfatase-modifying factor enzyme 1
MTETVKPTTNEKKRRRPWWVWLLLLLLLLLIPLTCSVLKRDGHGPHPSVRPANLDSLARLQRKADSLANARQQLQLRLDSLRIDSLRQAGQSALADSLAREHRKSLLAWQTRQRRIDSLHQIDSLQTARIERQRLDSLNRADSLRLASKHRKEPPYVVADPAGGVHPAPVDVAVLTLATTVTPLCSLDDSTTLKECRDLVRIDRNRVLWISAVDTDGVRAPLQKLTYRIDPDASRCGARRVLVPVTDTKSICVDAYEFPNEPSQMPRTSVSWEEASAQCARQGKRLCARQELLLACQGPSEWKYPYGPTHQTGHCQDASNSLARGHDHPGCRSWWGAYNLVGNAWEWTSTKAGSSYLAFGGYHGEGPEASCLEAKRSFFPQNKYSSVGFRCCEDAP